MNIVKGVVIGTMDETGALRHTSQCDQTLHINYINIGIFNPGHIALGSLCFMGIGVANQPIPYYINVPMLGSQSLLSTV